MFAAFLPVLSVYLAVAGLGLFLAHRFVTPISRGAAVFLLFAPLALTGKAVFTGGVYAPLDIAYEAEPLASIARDAGIGNPQTPLLGDVVSQEIPWRKAVRHAVKTGHLPLWNRFILAGEPLLAMQQPAILHPFTWAGMVLPLAHAWTLEMTLGVFLALLSGYLFFRDFPLSVAAAAVGAIGWAFCDYLVFWAGYPLAPGAAPFPLLLLGLRRIARDRNARSVGITTAGLVLVAAAGHSETLLHAVAAAGIWFLYCLATESRGARTRAILLSAAAGALTLGLTAVVLLPHTEALPHTNEFFTRSTWYAHSKKSRPLREAIRRFPQIVIPYASGVSGQGDTERERGEWGVANAYSGTLLLALAAVGLCGGDRRRWIFLLFACLGFSLWAAVPVVTDAVSALPLFDIAINERLVFLGCFGVAALAALGAEELARDRKRIAFAVSLAVTLAIVWAGYEGVAARLAGLGMPAAFRRSLFLAQIVPLAAALLFWVFRMARRSLPPVAAVAILAAILLAERAVEGSRLYPVIPNRSFYPHLSVLDPIPRGQPWRMAAVGFTFTPNVSAMYEVEDVRGYEAMTYRPLVDTYPLWCTVQPISFNRVDDPTRPFLSFLNVRYVLTPPGWPPPPGWKSLASSAGGQLVENPGVLPRAFAPRQVRLESDSSRQIALLGGISDFATLGVVTRIPGFVSGTTVPNGAASVAITAYDAGRMVLDVNAKSVALIGTSITSWPGWMASVDGSAADLFEFNRAFLAFVVPTGRHTVVLRYLPRSFLAGAAISGLTILLLAGWAVRRSRAARRAGGLPLPRRDAEVESPATVV